MWKLHVVTLQVKWFNVPLPDTDRHTGGRTPQTLLHAFLFSSFILTPTYYIIYLRHLFYFCLPHKTLSSLGAGIFLLFRRPAPGRAHSWGSRTLLNKGNKQAFVCSASMERALPRACSASGNSDHFNEDTLLPSTQVNQGNLSRLQFPWVMGQNLHPMRHT